MTKKITLKKISIPPQGNINHDIDYLCKSFGYFSERDKNDTAGKIFRILVKECSNKGLTSDEIASKVNITRGAAVHHLNSFIDSGIVVRENNTYRLRAESIRKCLEEIKEDTERLFKDMIKIAKDIDEKIGNSYR